MLLEQGVKYSILASLVYQIVYTFLIDCFKKIRKDHAQTTNEHHYAAISGGVIIHHTSTYFHSPCWNCYTVLIICPCVFDSQMQLRRGEKIIDRLDAIEDTKGNNGDRGTHSFILLG